MIEWKRVRMLFRASTWSWNKIQRYFVTKIIYNSFTELHLFSFHSVGHFVFFFFVGIVLGCKAVLKPTKVLLYSIKLFIQRREKKYEICTFHLSWCIHRRCNLCNLLWTLTVKYVLPSISFPHFKSTDDNTNTTKLHDSNR